MSDKYIFHQGGEQRFVIQSAETGAFVGLAILPFPNETPHAFSYDFGSVFYSTTVVNWQHFPSLAQINFFAIEYPSFHDFDRYLNHPEWQHLKDFFQAEGKLIAYNAARDKKNPDALPTLWEYTHPNPKGLWKIPAWSLWVNQEGCYYGDREGLMIALNHQGEITYQHQLPKNIHAIVGNDNNLYASCDDGKIYTLSGKIPQEVYNAVFPALEYYYLFPILNLDLWEDQLLIVDLYGTLTLLDQSYQIIWREKYDFWRGCFVGSDDNYIYLGHQKGVNCYQRSQGKLIWSNSTKAPVLSGVVNDQNIIIATSDGNFYRLNKQGDFKTQQTKVAKFAKIDTAIYSCTLLKKYLGKNYLFAADNQANLYCFNLRKNLISKNAVNCGAILELKTWGNHLYGVTTNGTIFCLNIAQLISENL